MNGRKEGRKKRDGELEEADGTRVRCSVRGE